MHENFFVIACDWAIFYFICTPLPVLSRYGPRVLFQTSLNTAIVVACMYIDVPSRPYMQTMFYSFTKLVINHVRFRFSESHRILGINKYWTTFSVDVAEAYYFSVPMGHAVGLFSHNLFRRSTVIAHPEACFR